MSILGPNVEKLKAARDVEGLIKGLDAKRPPVRVEAARALEEIGDARATEGLAVAAGMSARPSDRDDALKAAAVDALCRIADVDGLISILSGDGDAPRVGATLALGRIGGTRAVEPLLDALRGLADDPPIRAGDRWHHPHELLWATVVRSLQELGDARAVRPLVAAFLERVRLMLEQARPQIDPVTDPTQRVGAIKAALERMPIGSGWDAVMSFGRPALEEVSEAAYKEERGLMFVAMFILLRGLGGEEGNRVADELLARQKSDEAKAAEDGAPAASAVAEPAAPPDRTRTVTHSATVWFETEAGARRFMSDMNEEAASAAAIGKVLTEDGSTEAIDLLSAILGAKTDSTITANARQNTERGGFDVTIALEIT